MTGDDWKRSDTKAIGILLSGEDMDEKNECGEPVFDDMFLLFLNAHAHPVRFILPGENRRWSVELATHAETDKHRNAQLSGGETFDLPDRSVALLRQVQG